MENINIKFSELIKAMRGVVANLGSLAKADTLTDIETLARAYEQQEACPDLTKDDIYLSYYWCIRENGTELADFLEETRDWYNDWSSQAIAIYEIEFKNGAYSIRTNVEF